MRAARARTLTMVVHAVDDSGALCGAKPDGVWRDSDRLPVNCPRCLPAMAKPRFAVCETPTSKTSARHVRRVGMEGIGGAFGDTTLCGAVVGWDVDKFEGDETGICPQCRAALRRLNLRPADVSRLA